MKRKRTRIVNIGRINIGGCNPIIIQSMTTFKATSIDENIQQINHLTSIGCQMIRISVLDEDDVKALKEIKDNISIPLITDIHYSSKLAIDSLDYADKIRINPGNMNIKELSEIINKAKELNKPIRIGVNYGSIDKKFIHLKPFKAMIKSLDKWIKVFKDNKYENIVLSVKCSNIEDTIKANKILSKKYSYPLHIGLTESGDCIEGSIKSTLALSKLLEKGIGDTIRISLNGDRDNEIKACKVLLSSLNLINNVPSLIACPTCGRCKNSTFELVNKVNTFLQETNKNIKVAIMGCEVNGPGEASNADIGIALGKDSAIIFKKGKILRKIKFEDSYNELINEIKKMD